MLTLLLACINAPAIAMAEFDGIPPSGAYDHELDIPEQEYDAEWEAGHSSKDWE